MRNNAKEFANRLDEIGRNVPAFYEPVVNDLHQVRILTRAFETTVAALRPSSTSASTQAEEEDVEPIDISTQKLCDALQRARDVVGDPKTRRLLSNMQSECNQLSRFGKELNSLSFLMLVTTAHCASDAFSVTHLVSELRDMASSLTAAGKKISETLSQVEEVRNETETSLQQALNLIVVALGNTSVCHDDAQQMDVTSRGDAPRRMSEKLSADLAKLMPEIVACMQYPDAFAQRCDHMAMALRLIDEDGVNQASEMTIRRLVSAQLHDIASELNAVQGNALATLDQISNHSRQTLSDFENYLEKDESLAQIGAHQKHIEGTSGKLKRINDVAGTALSNLVACVEYFNGVEQSFKQLNEMREAVRMSSLNADLSERQAETNMPELRSVTKAVADCAGACGVTIEKLGAHYTGLKSLFGGINQEEVGGAISCVEERLSQSRRDLETLASQVQDIRNHTTECVETLGKIDALGRSAHTRIATNTMASKHLIQIDARICEGIETSPTQASDADPQIMQRVFETYSIERERDIHRTIVPENSEEKTLATEGDEQHDDDPLAEFLF